MSRVLFVDDEPNILQTLSAILRKKGFEVQTAASVPEALALINSSKFDVLLSDLNIGEAGDGFTLVSAMRRVQPEAATFILTGYPDFESALLAIRNQVDDYFTKPADVESLINTISKRLSEHKPPLRNLPPRRVGHILRDNASPICNRWLEAVENNETLSAIPLSHQERADHVPILLEEIASRLESGTETMSERGKHVSKEHGKIRHQQGYTVTEIVLETRILQREITACIQSNLLGVDITSLVPDLIETGDILTSLLELSLRAFEDEAQVRFDDSGLKRP